MAIFRSLSPGRIPMPEWAATSYFTADCLFIFFFRGWGSEGHDFNQASLDCNSFLCLVLLLEWYRDRPHQTVACFKSLGSSPLNIHAALKDNEANKASHFNIEELFCHFSLGWVQGIGSFPYMSVLN